jgi:hypothetical protein
MNNERSKSKLRPRQTQAWTQPPAQTLRRISAGLARPADVLQLQRTINNRAVTRLLTGIRSPKPAAPSLFLQQADQDEDAPPIAKYVIPFDRNPKSTPGEQIIFGAVYEHASPGDYKLVYSSEGGDFDSKNSGTTSKTIAGVKIRNLYWFVDPAWDGKTTTKVKLELQKTDGTVVATNTWNFSKKTYHPTTINQQEGEGEFNNPAVYTYKVGPDRGKDSKDDYIGWTVLEKFGTRSSNLNPADIKDAYAKTHNLTSGDAITKHFFPTSSNNGTFTVSTGDKFADRHGGMSGAGAAKAQLKTPKQIEVYLPQDYESEPGKTLGKYLITRILKADGKKKVKKKKT